MSKCDVTIHFDRPDRTYTGGETVTGRVHVLVNQDVEAKGVVLEHFWRTHGSGNTATGNMTTQQLYSGPLKAGQSLELPFEVAAPHGPATYRGKHLNVDHYLKARVDIPWAFDPKQEEEYLLVGSGEPYAELPKQQEAVSKKGCEQFGVVVGIGMLIVGVLLIFPFGIVLIPVGLLILFFSMRRKLAEKRLGPVALDWGPASVSPGGAVPLRLSFTPTKTIRINRIQLKLNVVESCTSGSGTNSTTHTHSIHDNTQRLSGEQTFAAFAQAEFNTVLELPDLQAYSFTAPDNSLTWQAELRIDLPLWPDWIDKRVLVALPPPPQSPAIAEIAQVIAQKAKAPEPELKPQPVDDPWSELHADLPAEIPPVATEPLATTPTLPVEPAAAVPLAGAAALPLVELLGAIVALSRYSQDREHIVEEKLTESFACPMRVLRTERTYAYDVAPEYRDGRTVHGIVPGNDEGSEHKISVMMRAERNDQIDGLSSGDAFTCQAVPVKWNSLYDRLEMRQS